MQMSVNLTNQRQRISRLLVSLRPANAANTDEGLEPDFIIAALKKGGRGEREKRTERERKRERRKEGGREMRDREMETNVCENTGLHSEPYQLQISN